PLFGLGQALIPAADEARRRYTFWLLVVYVGSGLGLLLTTCFLGLRQYLRQRKLQMPGRMAVTWLSVGGALIVALLLVAAFLPRPLSETPLVDFRAEGSQGKAAKEAKKDGSAGEGEGRQGAQDKPEADKGAGRDKADGKGKGDRDKGGSGKDGKDGKGKDRDKKEQGKQGDGDRQGEEDKKDEEEEKSSLSETLQD